MNVKDLINEYQTQLANFDKLLKELKSDKKEPRDWDEFNELMADIRRVSEKCQMVAQFITDLESL